MDAREINKAIAAHGSWKVRLLEAIKNGASDYLPGTVSLDNACGFGKWFYAIPVKDRPMEFWGKIQKTHARFHEEAGRILKLAVEGRAAEALALMTDKKGAFVTTSIELTTTLFEWKKVSL